MSCATITGNEQCTSKHAGTTQSALCWQQMTRETYFCSFYSLAPGSGDSTTLGVVRQICVNAELRSSLLCRQPADCPPPPPPTSWKLPGLAVRVLAGEGELAAEQLVVGVGRDERLENGLELQRTPTRQRPEKIQSGTASKRRGGANENNVSISSFEAQRTTKPPRPCRPRLPAHPRPA